MKHSKLWLALLLALCLSICLIACGEEKPPVADPGTDTTDTATESTPATETETETESESQTETQPSTDSETQAPTHTTCVDTDPKDAKCDVCGKDVPCATCVDTEPKDLKCDVCGKDLSCATCVDAEPKDNKCDVCGKQLGAPITDVAFEDTIRDFLDNDSAMSITQSSVYTQKMSMGGMEQSDRTEDVAIYSSLADGSFRLLNTIDYYELLDDHDPVLRVVDKNNFFSIGGQLYRMVETKLMRNEDLDHPLYGVSAYGIKTAATEATKDVAVGQYAQLAEKEFIASVADFHYATVSTDEDGNTVYFCTDPSDELIEEAFYVGPDGTLDKDSITYTLVVDEDGRILSWEVTIFFTVAQQIGSGQTMTVARDTVLSFTYDYEDPTFEAPETDENWFEMNEHEFVNHTYEYNYCPEECQDTNENGVCDSCGEILLCPGACVNGSDYDDESCDVCHNEIFCDECVDEDEDGFCDLCGSLMPCTEHVDGFDEYPGLCDNCGALIPCEQHVDGNDDFDGYCDVCYSPIE